VHALSRSEGSARSLAARARDTFGLQARVHAAAGAWLNEADCIVTSVPAAEGLEPFLDPKWIRPGAFVAACDLGRCWRPGLAGLDVVAVDDRTQEAALGHPMLPQADVDTDLVALVSGAHPGRTDATHRTAFVFRGMAVADLAAAWLLYHRTLDAGAAGPPAA
jgi:ornithine cyclodeaminase/alanine dehydrogenase-like protein (mu-crystallin family)